jgi:hypothetical protein
MQNPKINILVIVCCTSHVVVEFFNSYGNKPSGSIKGEEFLETPSKYLLVKEDFAPLK